MTSRRLTRAERRRQTRSLQKDLSSASPDQQDADNLASVVHSFGRLEGFCDGYIIGKLGIEFYRLESTQEMISRLPDLHCEDPECRFCRTIGEAVGYFIEADNDDEAYRKGHHVLTTDTLTTEIAQTSANAERKR